MNSGLSALHELQKQINAQMKNLSVLWVKQSKMIRQILPKEKYPAPKVRFDEKSRTITWERQTLRAGGKSYLFLKLLWESPKHRIKIEKAEQKLWKPKHGKRVVPVKTKSGERSVEVKSNFVSRNTIKSFINRLNNKLLESSFPYEVIPVRSIQTGAIFGYALKCTKKMQKSEKGIWS